MRPRAPRRTLVLAGAAILAGLLVRGIATFGVVPYLEQAENVGSTPDDYVGLARCLASEGTLAFPPCASPTTLRGPGFPAWLALPLLPLPRLSDRALAFWGAIPSILIGGLLVAWCERRLGLAAALLAAGVLLHPLPVFMTARGMSDEAMGSLAVAGIVLAVEKRTLPAALCLGAAMLVRANAAIALAALAVVSVGGGRAALRRFAPLAALALLPALAWSIRSSALEGRPVFVHSLGAYSFWIGEFIDSSGGRYAPSDWSRMHLEIARRGGGEPTDPGRFWYASLTPRETARLEAALTRAAVERIREAPAAFAGRVLRGLPRFWVGASTEQRSRQYALITAPVLLLAAIGAVRLGRAPIRWPLAVFVAGTCLLFAATEPIARASVEVYPALALLAAAALLPPTSSPREARARSGLRRC